MEQAWARVLTRAHAAVQEEHAKTTLLEGSTTIRVTCTYYLRDQDAGDMPVIEVGGVPLANETDEYGVCITDSGTQYDIHDDDLSESIVLNTGDEVTLTLEHSVNELGQPMWKIVAIDHSRSYQELDALRRSKYGLKLLEAGTVKEVLILTMRLNYLDGSPDYETLTDLDEHLFRLPDDNGYTTDFSGSIADMCATSNLRYTCQLLSPRPRMAAVQVPLISRLPNCYAQDLDRVTGQDGDLPPEQSDHRCSYQQDLC